MNEFFVFCFLAWILFLPRCRDRIIIWWFDNNNNSKQPATSDNLDWEYGWHFIHLIWFINHIIQWKSITKQNKKRKNFALIWHYDVSLCRMNRKKESWMTNNLQITIESFHFFINPFLISFTFQSIKLTKSLSNNNNNNNFQSFFPETMQFLKLLSWLNKLCVAVFNNIFFFFIVVVVVYHFLMCGRQNNCCWLHWIRWKYFFLSHSSMTKKKSV